MAKHVVAPEPTEVYGCGTTRHEAMQSLGRNLNSIRREFGIQYDIGDVAFEHFCDGDYISATAPLIKDLTAKLARPARTRSDA